MSNNIQSWKTKRMNKLVFPVASLYKHERQDWHPEPPTFDILKKELTFNDWDGNCIIKGILDGNQNIQVSEIDLQGEGSGPYYEYILTTALEDSSGELEAVLLYESSDIYKLHVKDGVVTETEIEL